MCKWLKREILLLVVYSKQPYWDNLLIEFVFYFLISDMKLKHLQYMDETATSCLISGQYGLYILRI